MRIIKDYTKDTLTITEFVDYFYNNEYSIAENLKRIRVKDSQGIIVSNIIVICDSSVEMYSIVDLEKMEPFYYEENLSNILSELITLGYDLYFEE